jgi:hypothetical protein
VIQLDGFFGKIYVMGNGHEIWNWGSQWSLETGILKGVASKLAKHGIEMDLKEIGWGGVGLYIWLRIGENSRLLRT